MPQNAPVTFTMTRDEIENAWMSREEFENLLLRSRIANHTTLFVGKHVETNNAIAIQTRFSRALLMVVTEKSTHSPHDRAHHQIDHTRHTTEAQDRTRQPHRRWGCVTPEVIHKTSQTQPCQRCHNHESRFRRVCPACRRKIGFDCRPEACWIKARNMCRDCLPRDEDQASA